MTEGQIRRVISDLYEQVSGSPLATATAREYFTGWLERKRVETGGSTADRYTSAVRPFLDFLGPRADAELMFVTAKDLTKFRDAQAKRLSVPSANLGLKILRVGFAQAFRDGLINENPATRVTIIKRQGGASVRRAFTLPELQRLLAESSGEWRGLIYFGLYTGQRIGDLARLTWQNLHGLGTAAPELRLVTGKTGRQQIIPLAKPLLRYVESELTAGDHPRAPLFPKMFQTIKRQEGRTGSLSGQFYRLMADAGLVARRSNHRAKDSKGRSAPRSTGELSFHCLRHTATSLMKNAGISPAIVEDIIGHDSSAVSAHYKRGAAERALSVQRKAWKPRKALFDKAEAAGISAPDPGPEPKLGEIIVATDRERLFDLIRELVKWENSNDDRVLNAARAEIMRSCNGHPPPVYDPFCGGGSIPLEAQRLGLEAHGSDLNPVPVLITKALIELPPKFAGRPPVNPAAGGVDWSSKGAKAQKKAKKADGFGEVRAAGWKGSAGLAADIRYYGRWMRDEAERRIGHLYPKVHAVRAADGTYRHATSEEIATKKAEELTVIAWLWARTVASPNPAAKGAHVPLVRSFWLST